MKQLTITFPPSTKNRNYPIYIGTNLVEKITSLFDLTQYSKIFVITDTTVEKLFLKKLLRNLPEQTKYIAVPPGEKAKHIESVMKIWTAMKDAGLDRKSLVINLGGGVIGDVGAFATSTYMRGLAFINIPTTLLAQVDESVGGKNGIDFAGIKNIVGTFDQPDGVIIDLQMLKTLPKRAFLASFVEIIKHGMIHDKHYFEKVTSKYPTDFTDEELIAIIYGSCEIKAYYVQNDEQEENGKRKILNFGHTIGHAIEAIKLETDEPLLHGEAVSLGIIAESEISRQMGLLSSEEMGVIKHALQKADAPITVTNIVIDDILKRIKSDKKNTFNKINFSLLQGIGNAVYNRQVPEEIISSGIKAVLK
ncbi:MAG: 3-dehydroquinate synthase [Candidatus Levyibacteriota bacterium]